MTNQRDPDKVHIGAYITKAEKQKLEQIQYEFGNLTQTEVIRMLIREQETYGKYKPVKPSQKSKPDYTYPKEQKHED